MDEIQKFMHECNDSSQWYHERSDEQRQFDGIVMDELARGRKIRISLNKAARQMPEMNAFLTEKSISELKEYYAQLKRIEQETAIVSNFRMIAAMRKRKAQQEHSD